MREMTIPRRISPTVRALVALVIASLCVGLGIQVAEGAKAKVLGRTKADPRPMCPAKEPANSVKDMCEVTGQVTGFQRSADGRKGLFKVRETGKIVAWSVDLANPSKSERETFGEAAATNRYGKAPTAGISIIRATSGSEFRLKKASPVLSMRSYYGRQPVITLDKPLRVRKGDVVALTTETWLPAFTRINQTNEDAWVASRNKKNCSVPDSVPPEQRLEYFFDHTSPHRKIDSERKYQCVYKGARILYWAYFVPKN